MRKIFILAISILMLMMCLIGCGQKADDTVARIGSLKGPTSLGLLKMMSDAEDKGDLAKYNFTIEGTADALTAPFIKGDLDIILIPANVASVLYNKTEGEVVALDINTLGVLYVIATDESINTVADLKGKTIVLTGKGTTPDYVLTYLLRENGISADEVTLEYKTEATEVATYLAEDEAAVGLLPQPYVTSVLMQNENMRICVDLTEEWNKIRGEDGSRLVTGVTIARKEFADEHPQIIEEFIKAHSESVDFANTSTEEAAALAAKYGITGNEKIALKAIPYCNIVCLKDSELKDALSGYLETLYEMDAKSIGGQMPGEDFY